MPTVHLLHGLPGCGKTTFARRLERDLPAVRFTHDEWMVRLYGHDPADTAKRFQELFAHVSGLIWSRAAATIQTNRNVILDHGFWTRQSRDEARAKVLSLGASFRLYAFPGTPEELLPRVLLRNQHLPADSLYIHESAFSSFLARYEPLGEDEEHVVIASPANEAVDPALTWRPL